MIAEKEETNAKKSTSQGREETMRGRSRNRRVRCMMVGILAILLLAAVPDAALKGGVSASKTAEMEEMPSHGDVTAADAEIPAEISVRSARLAGGQEPDVEFTKTARWTDIENGYAELTITERDTSAASNLPVDYIFILDRTRTMSLNESTFESGNGEVKFQQSNSPCINPSHYYYKGGIYLWLKDYYTGYDFVSGNWITGLRGDMEFWNRHYNEKDEHILPTYENGCYDRLSMAKQALHELTERVAEQNEQLPASALKSRIAFWSFGSSYEVPTGDKREQGLYNYTPLTSDYSKIQNAIDAVKTYSGTYYLESFREAYDILVKRNSSDSQRRNLPAKVVFISDGECTDQVAESKAVANQIKALPNTEIYTLAIGMTADSSGTQLLRELASSDRHTASFWQNLSFSGGAGSALAETLFRIDDRTYEVKAVNKVVTDQIETAYWEPLEVVRASGGTSNVTLDTDTGVLRWKVPEGTGTTHQCTIKIRLKDAYRYLLSDTSYPTNRDAKGATEETIAADPALAGALLEYQISGGTFHGQSRKTGTMTPFLKYGTVQFFGQKNWTVKDSEKNQVTLQLLRTMPGQTEMLKMNQMVTDAKAGWRFAFEHRIMEDGSLYPLIKYDEQGNKLLYEITETDTGFYQCLPNRIKEGEPDENGGIRTEVQLCNEPFKRKVQIHKADAETGNPLTGAVFSVFMWSEAAQEYIPYRGTTNPDAEPYETGSMTGASAPVQLRETEKGVYESSCWLYYSPDNQGKFRVVETKAPDGYFGDWKETSVVSGSFFQEDKQVYDVQISDTAEENGTTVVLSREEDGILKNQRVRGNLTFSKEDSEAGAGISQGDAALKGAVYRLYAAAELIHRDGTTGVLYQKDEEIRVRFTGNENGRNIYTWDPNGSDMLVVGDALQVTVENLEIGCYYLQEESAGTGYLVNPNRRYFTVVYRGEAVETAEITDLTVKESVKKQALAFYKVTGTDKTDQLDPLEGAGFSVYLLSELAGGAFADLTDEEIPQAMIDAFRDPHTLGYEALLSVKPAVVYAQPEDGDVTEGRLTKEIVRPDGIRLTTDTENPNAYLTAELTSDSKGIVTTPALPYGRYVVIETTTPKNKIASRPFVIHVQGDDADAVTEGDGKGVPLENLVLLMDRPIQSLVRLVKQDAESGKTILKPGAAYVIHDVEGAWFDYYTAEMTTLQKLSYQLKYKDLVVQYSQGEPIGSRQQPFLTRQISQAADSGQSVFAETPQELPGGVYELEEVQAPEGYVLAGEEGVIAKDPREPGNQTFYETRESGFWESTPQERIRFVVSSGEAVYDEQAGTFITEVRQQNSPAIGKIAVYAEGERVTGYKDFTFTYAMEPVEGAEFEIRASGDIYSQEGGSHAQKLYGAGELIVTLTTDVHGKAWTGQEDWPDTCLAKGLPIGNYTVTQTKAGEGFALSEENARPREITIAYAGQEVPVIYRNTSYTNPRQKVWLEVEKQDASTLKPLSGAVFGLYLKEDLVNENGKVLVKAGAQVAQAKTFENADGEVQNVVFDADLPLAAYEIRELEAPCGYVSNGTKVNIDVSYREDQRETIEMKRVIRNEPIRVQINLMDAYTREELGGAQLMVLDAKGVPLAETVTVHEGNEILLGLEAGQTYTIRALSAAEGYSDFLYIKEDYVPEHKKSVELEKGYPSENAGNEVTFCVQDTEMLQTVSLFQKPMQGELTIQKTGEEAVDTERSRDEAGRMLVAPIYELRGLPGAEYVLRAREEIGYPDGYSGVLFKKGEIILDVYEERREELLFAPYQLAIAGETGTWADVSPYLGIRPASDASKDELQVFYEVHKTEVERQIPSDAEMVDPGDCFSGTGVRFVLRTNADGLVRLTGLPLGSYEVIEVKAPEGYYRDKRQCIQTAELKEIEGEAGIIRGSAAIQVQFTNDRQQVEEPEELLQPEPVEVLYHPSLFVTKKADRNIYAPGETVSYRITVCNDGDVDLSDLVVTDSLAGGEINKIPLLKVHETFVFTYTYVIPEDAPSGSQIRNTVKAVGTPQIPETDGEESDVPVIIHPASWEKPEASAQEKVFVSGARLQVKKTARKQSYMPGETALYEITVMNSGTESLFDITVTDSLNGTFRTSDADKNWETGEDGSVRIHELPALSRITLLYEFRIPADIKPGILQNTVFAEAFPQKGGGGNSITAEDQEMVWIGAPRIAIRKEAEKQIYEPGETARYTIVVTNTGDCPLTEVSVTEQLLKEGCFTDSTKGTYEGCQALIDELEPGEEAVLCFSCQVPPNAGSKTALYNLVAATGKTELIRNPSVPEGEDGTPEYLPRQTVSDSDEELVYVKEQPAGFTVTKYQVWEGIRTCRSGAVFTLYAKETVRNLHGTVIYRAGQEIESAVSDADGKACFLTDVPVGRYQIKETQPPAGCYSTSQELIFQADQYRYDDQIRELSYAGMMENAAVAVQIKLTDDQTGMELAGALLEVTDLEGNLMDARVTQVSNGYLLLGLEVNTPYTIREKVPREGYLEKFTRVSAQTDRVILTQPYGSALTFMLKDMETGNTGTGKLDHASASPAVRLVLENPFVTGQLRINKDGELLKGWTLGNHLREIWSSLFLYEKQPLQDVEFTVYAKEDILHPDGLTGILLKKGEAAFTGVRSLRKTAAVRTDSQGMAVFDDLYLGIYEIRETKGADGFQKDTEPRSFTLSYVDGKTSPVTAQDGILSWTNERKKLRICIKKADAETMEPLKGAVFGLFNESAIFSSSGQELLPADTLLELTVSDEKGQVLFTSDLPQASYYVKEVKSPPGYRLDPETVCRLSEEDIADPGVPVFDNGAKNSKDMTEGKLFCNQPEDVRLEVKKSAPENIRPGEVFLYAIEQAENAGNCRVEQLMLTDLLPEETELLVLHTGTFQGLWESDTYSIWYQTNLHPEYRLWKDEIPSSQNLQLMAEDLPLEKKEIIRAFQYRFGTVQKGFSQVERPVYAVRHTASDQNRTAAVSGTKILKNQAVLTAQKYGCSYEASDRAETEILQLERTSGNSGTAGITAAKTGDQSSVGSYLFLLLSVLILMGVCIGKEMVSRRNPPHRSHR